MISENRSFSFGHYLQAFRIERGISLEELSRETKIGIDCLSLIENEQIDKLPPEVFVKGFLRSYARVVNADGDEAVRRYLTCIGVINQKIKPEKELNKTGLKYWHKIFLLSGFFLFIIIISVASVYELSDKTGPAENSKQKKRSSDIKQNVIKEKSSEKTGEELSLKILAVKDTWLKVIIDGQNPKEYILNNGDILELKASSGYNLLVGDAGAIKLSFNEKAFDIARESGRAANIQIP
ncbi:MAG: DUF4115 domain-containing protein [Proteobacteria bacterium]|nr:DUF4115 domain-containing protein [Pseudomonadota bacterium]